MKEDRHTTDLAGAARHEQDRGQDYDDPEQPMVLGPARSVNFLDAFHRSREELARIAEDQQSRS